jgi:RNA polymerase sigma-70 factor (ECF subfamily)
VTTAALRLTAPSAVLTLPEPSAREPEHASSSPPSAADTESFAALVRLHQRRAYAVARAIVLTHEDAEDAVQEGFLHAFRALDRFLPDQAFGAWLNRIVANAALDITRRKKVRDADALADTIASPFRDPAESAELRRRLTGALSTLNERQRRGRVARCRGVQACGDRPAASIPEGTARSDLHHARARLRQAPSGIRAR